MSQQEEEYTSIRVSIKTRDRLLDLGKKSDTYDDVIGELLKRPERK